MTALASAAAAAVKVRVAVHPDTIPQCSPAHFFFALANTGDQPIIAGVCITLVGRDSAIVGPVCRRVRLGAGQRLAHEHEFFVPRVPPGRYAFVARARGSDGSEDMSVAPFLVVRAVPPSPCAGDGGLASDSDLSDQALQGMPGEPESPTIIQRSTWGSLKQRYR